MRARLCDSGKLTPVREAGLRFLPDEARLAWREHTSSAKFGCADTGRGISDFGLTPDSLVVAPDDIRYAGSRPS